MYALATAATVLSLLGLELAVFALRSPKERIAEKEESDNK
jgi:hypothetical protein